jgi:hypothetical protein
MKNPFPPLTRRSFAVDLNVSLFIYEVFPLLCFLYKFSWFCLQREERAGESDRDLRGE